MVDKEVCDVGLAMGTPFSSAIKVVPGTTVYVSGQVASAGEEGEVPETIEEQTQIVLEKIASILDSAGAKVSDIVKMTVYLKSFSNYIRFNVAYVMFFEAHGVNKFPARSTVEVGNLSDIRYLVEIDCIAVI